MSTEESVSHWISQLKIGDAAAAEKLWERYFEKLVRVARSKLYGLPRRASDEEDVALSAFDSFCRAAENGRLPPQFGRDNLWRLLVVITSRKAFDLARLERRQKRGGGGVLDEAALGNTATERQPGFEQIIGQEPTPAFAAQVAEQCQRLLALLESAELRTVALWKMEGYTNEEIAAKRGCTPRTIERKLWVIRNIWAKELSG